MEYQKQIKRFIGSEERENANQRDAGKGSSSGSRCIKEELLCVVCYAHTVDAALGPCGHVGVCQYCSSLLKECPLCREKVKNIYLLPSYLVERIA